MNDLFFVGYPLCFLIGYVLSKLEERVEEQGK